MPGSGIVVNHQVMLSGAVHHAAIGASRLLYIANRPGAVALKTDDDLRIEAENERMAKLGYIGFRPGSVAEPNRGHALFDAHGVPERAAVQRELKATESAIITSVVSVRREDAEALGLATKQQWERFLRGNWQRYVDSLGVMAPQDVRWVAAFHVNQRNNLHVHVLTWDDSGRFDSLLPKRRMVEANERLRAAALKPQRDELSFARTQARNELVEAVKSADLGEDRRDAVLAALPGEGSLKYAKLARFHPEARAAVDAAVGSLISDRADLRRLRERYIDAAAGHARLKGLEGAAREAHMAAAEADLRTRLGNAVVANVRAGTPAPGPEDERTELAQAAAPEVQAPRLGKGPSPEARPPIALETQRMPPGWGAAAGGPADRLAARRLAEELSSCLAPADFGRVAEGVRGLARGSADELGRCRPELNKLPSINGRTAAICGSAAANARGLAALAAQAGAPAAKRDAGSEAAQEAARLVFCAAKALALASRFAAPYPAGRSLEPKEALKNGKAMRL